MIRGDNLYASGIVLVTPLEMEVLEDAGQRPGSDHRSRRPHQGVSPQGSGQGHRQRHATFISGETDLRGVFVAEGLQGTVTAVARNGKSQYAFYRGTNFLGKRTETGANNLRGAAPAQGKAPAPQEQSLDANLKMQNTANSAKQIERLHQRFAQPADKSKGAAAGGFR